MDYDEMLHAALPKMPGYARLSDAAKELLALGNALDLKHVAECRASLETYQQGKGLDEAAFWGTVALSLMELVGAGLIKKAGIDMQKRLFCAIWSDEVKEAALKEGER